MISLLLTFALVALPLHSASISSRPAAPAPTMPYCRPCSPAPLLGCGATLCTQRGDGRFCCLGAP